MSSLNHHYVPQFYLRFFASDRSTTGEPRRINLYNMKRNLFVQNASIKEQCYKRKFYGETDELERKLAVVEYVSSIILSLIIKFEKLPPRASEVYQNLLFFTLLQKLRTKHQADIQNDMIAGVSRAILEEDSRFKDVDFDEFKIELKNPVLLALSTLTPDMLQAIDDLEPHLVLLGGHRRFIVGDTPVVTYNQYFEWMRGLSNTGLVSKGLQMFFPLSPQCLFFLYDKEIYHINGQQNITHDITENDLRQINALQYINANENIYFDNINYRPQIELIVNRYERDKKEQKTNIQKFDKEQKDASSEKSLLITTFAATPNMHLNLSFIQVKRSAKKIPLRQRVNDRYRKEKLELPALKRNNFEQPRGSLHVVEKFIKRQDKK